MVKRYIFPSVIFSLIISVGAFGQELSTLKGHLVDQTNGEAIAGATLSLVLVSDTTVAFTMGSDQDGYFVFDRLSPAFYKLRYKSIGYKPGLKYVRIQSPETNIGNLPVEPDVTELENIEVIGKAISVEIKGDTTSIDANAFKSNPDANVEDLISKMPGIIINGSGVQAQGESVQKVLVDGREFFANDPSIALKNIPAEIVEKIEIFDQLSEQAQFSGFDDGNTTKTLNIVTRVENRKGDFGRVYGGVNLDNQYKLGGNFNHFDDTLRFSVIGLSNNINQQNFSSEDMLGISSASSGRGGRGGMGGGVGSFGGGGSETFQTGSQPGISETHAYGLNYSNEWESLRFTGSYFFNALDNDNEQLINRENFMPDGENQYYNEVSGNYTKNFNHRVNARLIYTIDDKNSIIFTPNLSFQDTKLNELLTGQTSLATGETINTTSNQYNSKNSGYNIGGSVLYRHRFEKRGRTLSIMLSGQDTENNGDAGLDNSTLNFGTRPRADTTLQQINQLSGSTSFTSSINYTEPIGQWGQLQLGYRNSLNFDNSDKRTFDILAIGEPMPLDTTLSNVFDSEYITHSPSTGVMLRKNKLMLRIGIAYQWASLNSNQTFPQQATIARSFTSWLPTAMIRYGLSRESNLRIFYRSFTQNPSIQQLQNVVDNSNPLYLTAGNPGLDQATNNMFTARYSSINPKNASSFFVLGSLRTINDYITNATFIAAEDSVINNDIILRQGRQISVPVNINGYLNSRILFTYGIPSVLLKSNLNFSLGTTYTRLPGKVNTIENTSHTLTYNAGFVLASNISENLDFSILYDLALNDVRNDVETSLSNEYTSHNAGFKLNWIFLGGFVLRSQLNYQFYDGYTEGFKNSYTLWNVSLARKFLKENRGELALSVFDLLDENTSLNRVNAESYIEEVQTNVLQQYFMLTFTYTFSNFKGFVDRPDPREQFRQGQGAGRW